MAWMTRSAGDEVGGAGVSGSREPKPPAMDVAETQKSSGRLLGESALSDHRRFCDRLRGASFEQMTELLGEAQAFSDAFRRRSSMELVLEQMARTDPERAWSFLASQEHADKRDLFLESWGRIDAAGALTWAEKQGEAEAGHVGRILAGLVPDDVEALVALLPRLKPGQVDESQWAAAFRVLRAEDSSRALKLLEGLEPGIYRNAAASSLAEGWARGDAASAYAWAKNLEDPAQRESALRGVFRAWAESDPQGVATKLDELAKDGPKNEKGEPLSRGESPVQAIVRAWAAQDPMAAAAWLRDRPDVDFSTFKHLFALEILPTRDGWPAAELAEMMRRPGDKPVTDRRDELYKTSMGWGDGDGTMYRMIGEYGGFASPLLTGMYPGENSVLRIDDPARTFDEVSRQPGDAARQHVLQEVASQWAAKDPQGALAKLRETTDDFLKLGLINALSNLATQNRDPMMAAEVAKAFPDSPGNRPGQHLTYDVHREIVQHEPERALALLAGGELDSVSKASLASALATRHAVYDPVGALAWAATQPDESLQSAATKSAASSWAWADAYGMSEWLTTQPAGPLREVAVLSLVGALAGSSPEEALAWAGSLTDPKIREAEQVNLITRYAVSDPVRARQMAEQIPFSDEARQKVKSRLDDQERNQ